MNWFSNKTSNSFCLITSLSQKFAVKISCCDYQFSFHWTQRAISDIGKSGTGELQRLDGVLTVHLHLIDSMVGPMHVD